MFWGPAGLAPHDEALWEVLLEECTSYQPQPELTPEERQELVSEVSGDLMEPGATDPAVDDLGKPVDPDAAAPRMTRIASGELCSTCRCVAVGVIL